MFQRLYKVEGEDVNDFMVMQNIAYLKYSSKLMETFLFNKGFTKLKMNSLKVGLQKSNDQIIQKKHLMFTQGFTVQLEFVKLNFESNKMNVKIHFFNNKEEICATVVRDLSWFDYDTWKTISPPKIITNYFSQQKTFRNAS
jgi:acyl-CoA thioesterase FadM